MLPIDQSVQILDVGCGTGVISAALRQLGHRVIGIDVAEDGIAIARNAVPDIRFELASAYDDWSAFMPPGGWDVILAVEVIEHLYSPQRFLRNAHRSLRPGGMVVVTTPYHGYLKNLALSLVNAWDRHLTVHREGGHIKFFSRRTMNKMLEDTGFQHAEFRFVGRAPGLWKDMIVRARSRVSS